MVFSWITTGSPGALTGCPFRILFMTGQSELTGVNSRPWRLSEIASAICRASGSLIIARLEKWEVYQGLSRHKEIAGYLPETILYRSELDLQRMFNKYRLVFLKFSGGSGGKEVLSMEKEPGGIKVSFIRGGYYRERTYPSTGWLHMSLYQVIASAPGQIILQQGLRLVRYRGNVLDLRVLLVKNRDGRWVDVYNQARIAGRGANITNIAQGGTVMNYSDLIPDLRKSYSRVPADEQIRADALLIASYLEKVFGPFGEIGMDMAVDEDGKVWFLEGNSKASKLPERGLEDTRGISPQFLLILEYAIFLFQKSKV